MWRLTRVSYVACGRVVDPPHDSPELDLPGLLEPARAPTIPLLPE